MEVGVCEWPVERWCCCWCWWCWAAAAAAAAGELALLGSWGLRWLGVEGLFVLLLAWVAATRRGFTPWAAGWWRGPGFWRWAGVFVPPVGRGVDICEGSSEVKIVPEEGERTYFCVMVARRAWGKPG